MQQVIANHGTLQLPMNEIEKNAIHKRAGYDTRITLIEADSKANTFVFEVSGSKGGPFHFQLPEFKWLDDYTDIENDTDDHFERWMGKRIMLANVSREIALTTCLIFNNERAISALTELKNFYNSASSKQREVLLRGTNTQRIDTIRKIIGVKLAYKFKLDKLNSNRVKAIAFYLCGKIN